MKWSTGIEIEQQFLERREIGGEDGVDHHDETGADQFLVLGDQRLAVVPLGMLRMEEGVRGREWRSVLRAAH